MTGDPERQGSRGRERPAPSSKTSRAKRSPDEGWNRLEQVPATST
jgi:hypothetical protein